MRVEVVTRFAKAGKESNNLWNNLEKRPLLP
jgi:hypothetical protein